MTETRWTAPETGWYRVDLSQTPEFFGTEQPVFTADPDEVLMPQTVEIFTFDAN